MQQLEQEKFGNPPKPFHLLSKDERNKIEKKRVQGNLLILIIIIFFEI